MGERVWTCTAGTEFLSEDQHSRLIVDRSPRGSGYRYQVFSRDNEANALASGTQEMLRDAFDAAEAAARSAAPLTVE